MATWRLAAGRSRHGTRLSTHPARVRSFLFDGKLVSRLHRILRRLRRRPETLRHRCPVGAPQTDPEKRCGQTHRSGRSRLGMFSAGMGAHARESYLSAWRRAEAGFLDPRAGGRRGERCGRAGRVATAMTSDRLPYQTQSPAASTAGKSSASARVETFALVTRITDATMIALPSRM